MYLSVKAHSFEPGATPASTPPCPQSFALASRRGNRHALAGRFVR